MWQFDMRQSSTFLGSIKMAPQTAQRVWGTLLPVEPEAKGTVLFVPAGKSQDVEAIVLDEANTHLLILAETGARLTVRVRMRSGGERRHTTEMLVRDGAVCAVTVVQECDDGARLTMREEARIGKHATLTWQTRAIGAGDIDHALRSTVAGEQARSDIVWTCRASGTQRRSLRAENVFQAAQGSGEMTLRGIAEERATLRVLGKVIVGEHGSRTNTFLTQDVLMLDPTAKVDAVPALEIKTNDVKASHSASVRRITPEDLFYFGARGIAQETARNMFIRGFLGMAADASRGIE